MLNQSVISTVEASIGLVYLFPIFYLQGTAFSADLKILFRLLFAFSPLYFVSYMA